MAVYPGLVLQNLTIWFPNKHLRWKNYESAPLLSHLVATQAQDLPYLRTASTRRPNTNFDLVTQNSNSKDPILQPLLCKRRPQPIQLASALALLVRCLRMLALCQGEAQQPPVRYLSESEDGTGIRNGFLMASMGLMDRGDGSWPYKKLLERRLALPESFQSSTAFMLVYSGLLEDPCSSAIDT